MAITATIGVIWVYRDYRLYLGVICRNHSEAFCHWIWGFRVESFRVRGFRIRGLSGLSF